MKLFKLFPIFACAIFLVACHTKKHAEPSADGKPVLEKEANLSEVIQRVNAKRVSEPCITARVSLSLSTGKNSARVGGSLKMKRNDVIQLSLVALGIMEAGRLELTPEYMMVIDRVNHQYVKCAYQDVQLFREAGIDFYTFQSLFWDELFELNGKGGLPAEKSFTLTSGLDGVKLVNHTGGKVALTFVLNSVNQLVSETHFSRAETSTPILKWEYAEWEKLGEQNFPGSMKISFALPGDTVEALLRLGTVKPDSDWETRTEVNKNRYTEVSLQTAFRRLMSLAQ